MSSSILPVVSIKSDATWETSVWETSSDASKGGHYLEGALTPQATFNQEDVEDINTATFNDTFETEGYIETIYSSSVNFKIIGKGSVEDGEQNGNSTDYLANIQTKNYHLSTSYYEGYGGGSPASHSEAWYGNPEKEAYHPFIHKQRLNDKLLIHSASQYECVLNDGTIGAKNNILYGYWDNDRSITGSIDSNMASKGFLPSEVTPPNNYAYKSQKYMGTSNKVTTTYDGKDAFEVHETSPTVLVVSDTSPNTLAVQ